jgi:hypothetical protein
MSFLQGFISIFLGIVFFILEGIFIFRREIVTVHELENTLARRKAVLARFKGLKDTPLVPKMKKETAQGSLLIAALIILIIEGFLIQEMALAILILSTIILVAISSTYQSHQQRIVLDKAERQKREVVRLSKILHRAEKSLAEEEANAVNKKIVLDKQRNILKVVLNSIIRDLSRASSWRAANYSSGEDFRSKSVRELHEHPAYRGSAGNAYHDGYYKSRW